MSILNDLYPNGQKPGTEVPEFTDAPMYDLKQLAKKLRCRVGTLRKWQKQGRLPKPDVEIGRKRKKPRWHYETIKEMLDAGKI